MILLLINWILAGVFVPTGLDLPTERGTVPAESTEPSGIEHHSRHRSQLSVQMEGIERTVAHVSTHGTIPGHRFLPQRRNASAGYRTHAQQPVGPDDPQRSSCHSSSALRTMGSLEIHQLMPFGMSALCQRIATGSQSLRFRSLSRLFRQRSAVHSNWSGTAVFYYYY